MSGLDYHKKQAKLYLRWHREGHYPVAAIIREHLSQFEGMLDQDIMRACFRLSDAQLLVARRLGFESWMALAQESTSVQPTFDDQKPQIIASEPQLFVSNMDTSLRFYKEKLGFDTAFSYGEPIFYAQVMRDGGRINLRLARGPVFNAEFLAREGNVLCATFTVDKAKPLFIEYQAAGVDFHQKLRTEPWGTRTFGVRDPDGNILLFAGA